MSRHIYPLRAIAIVSALLFYAHLAPAGIPETSRPRTNIFPRVTYRPVITNKVMNSDGSFTTFYTNSVLFSRRQYRTGDMDEVYTNGLVRKTFWRKDGARLFSKRRLKNNLVDIGVWTGIKSNMQNTAMQPGAMDPGTQVIVRQKLKLNLIEAGVWGTVKSNMQNAAFSPSKRGARMLDKHQLRTDISGFGTWAPVVSNMQSSVLSSGDTTWDSWCESGSSVSETSAPATNLFATLKSQKFSDKEIEDLKIRASMTFDSGETVWDDWCENTTMPTWGPTYEFIANTLSVLGFTSDQIELIRRKSLAPAKIEGETVWDEWSDSTTLEEDNPMVEGAFNALEELGLTPQQIRKIKAESVAE